MLSDGPGRRRRSTDNNTENDTGSETGNETAIQGLVKTKFPPSHPALTKMMTVNGSIVCPHMFTHFSNAYYFTSIATGLSDYNDAVFIME